MMKLLEQTVFTFGEGWGKVTCHPDWVWENPLPFNDFDIWYVMRGKGTIRLNGKEFPLSAGSCFTFRPGDRPFGTQDPNHPLTVIFIHFNIRYSAAAGGCPLFPISMIFDNRYKAERLLLRLLEVMDRNELWQAEEFNYLIKLLFLLMFRNVQNSPHAEFRLNDEQNEKLREAVRHIGECDGMTDLAETAGRIGWTAKYLSRLFTKHSGVSFKEYVTRVKMERARHLLADTSNITETAEALGYSDIYVFSHLFKKYCGLPPGHWREQQKNRFTANPGAEIRDKEAREFYI